MKKINSFFFDSEITSVYSKNNEFFVGTDSGKLYKNKKIENRYKNYLIKGFKREFDNLENENVNESILNIEKITEEDKYEKIIIANEKNIKIIKTEQNNYLDYFQDLNKENKNNYCDIYLYNKMNIKNYKNLYKNIKRKTLYNAHRYIINSLSFNISNEYLLSSDLLKINLWNHNIDKCINIIDLKNDINEGNIFIINKSEFSKYKEDLIIYSTSKGTIEIQDMKISPKTEKIYRYQINENIIKSITDFIQIDENKICYRVLNQINTIDLRKGNDLYDKNEIKNKKESVNPLSSFNISTEINDDNIYDKLYLTKINNCIYSHNENYIIKIKNNKKEEIDLKDKIKKIEKIGNNLLVIYDKYIDEYKI